MGGWPSGRRSHSRTMCSPARVVADPLSCQDREGTASLTAEPHCLSHAWPVAGTQRRLSHVAVSELPFLPRPGLPPLTSKISKPAMSRTPMKYWRGCLVSRVALILVTIQLNIFSYIALASAPVAYATWKVGEKPRYRSCWEVWIPELPQHCASPHFHLSSKCDLPAGHSAPW